MIPGDDNPNIFTTYRMLPPGNHKYFFTVVNKLTVSKSVPSVPNLPTVRPIKEPKASFVFQQKAPYDLQEMYFSNIKVREDITGGSAEAKKNPE